MSDAWLVSCGLKKKHHCDTVVDSFTKGDRQDLFEDLLEDDVSVFPLLDVPPEVLTVVGIFLDARHLAILSQLNVQAQLHLDVTLADAWAELLLRDYAFRSRAKRYKAFSSSLGEAKRSLHGSAGLVLTAVDLCRVEWDGLLVIAPFHVRYRFFDTMRAWKNRWGKMAQSWEWFATRILHRTTHEQVERFVPGHVRPCSKLENSDEFDEVSHQASLDRDLRQRHKECNPIDVIASMKRSLGIETATDDQSSRSKNVAMADNDAAVVLGQPADDVLSALAPTARDHRVHQIDGSISSSNLLEMPPAEVVEKMSFSEQLDLALRVSQSTEFGTDESPNVNGGSPHLVNQQPSEADVADGDDRVIFRLKASRTHKSEEPLEVVIKEFTVGETLSVPEQLRRPLEQVALRLTRNNWLLFYEGIAVEAQLRVCALASRLRTNWPQGQVLDKCKTVRTCADLEPELLQLPVFQGKTNLHLAQKCNALVLRSPEEMQHLRLFLEAWKEHESWVESLEEHLGPLDLEISRERTNNLQRGKEHTPYTADMCRLAFRNFAICEARLFFRLALSIYSLIIRLWVDETSGQDLDLLEGFCAIGETYSVQDDALTIQRNTLHEYRYYLLEPLQRARAAFFPGEDTAIDNHAFED